MTPPFYEGKEVRRTVGPCENLDVPTRLAGSGRASTSDLVKTIQDGRRVALRAGSKPHRLTSLWAVVVDGRVFVRSWSVKPRSWYRTLLREPHGVLKVKERTWPFRSVRTRSAVLKAAVDRAYREKYDHPGDLPYTRDMTGAKSRATTTELVFD
jgi:hypothetical protein